MQERLQKFLANSGLGSRRYCESLIKEGKILVNGKVAELGSKVGLSDEIFYEGKVISRAKSDLKVIVLNKPEGVLCLLYTSPSPRDVEESRMPSSA